MGTCEERGKGSLDGLPLPPPHGDWSLAPPLKRADPKIAHAHHSSMYAKTPHTLVLDESEGNIVQGGGQIVPLHLGGGEDLEEVVNGLSFQGESVLFGQDADDARPHVPSRAAIAVAKHEAKGGGEGRLCVYTYSAEGNLLQTRQRSRLSMLLSVITASVAATATASTAAGQRAHSPHEP
jgi:hypothetical protein